MTIEEIAVRREIRQMLNEAGYNKETMKELVKDVLAEKLDKAVNECFNQMNLDNKIEESFSAVFEKLMKREIHNKIKGTFCAMKVSVDITDSNNDSILNNEE